eukprot:TRINITY_DN19972_c0_g1_i1.p1 TRINITY_DN19972_c0_g1~~TRINITY_DN19972_c0_g1_i1.p1  ORF type:complete len:206 (+),score=28.29 TRINITY_DN19972_c0_g1_i1:57-674(+)
MDTSTNGTALDPKFVDLWNEQQMFKAFLVSSTEDVDHRGSVHRHRTPDAHSRHESNAELFAHTPPVMSQSTSGNSRRRKRRRKKKKFNGAKTARQPIPASRSESKVERFKLRPPSYRMHPIPSRTMSSPSVCDFGKSPTQTYVQDPADIEAMDYLDRTGAGKRKDHSLFSPIKNPSGHSSSSDSHTFCKKEKKKDRGKYTKPLVP